MTEEIDKTEKGVFRLKKYSFTLKDTEFTTTNGYKIEKINDKIFINLASPAECTAFFEDLTEKNLKASSIVYYYFAFGKSPTGEELKFNDLVKYLKNLCLQNEDTKNLVNCFKVIIENKNYKIIVTSYLLIKYMNADKLFKIYTNHNNYYFKEYNNPYNKGEMYGKGMYGKGMYGKGMYNNFYDNDSYGKGIYGKGTYGKGTYGKGTYGKGMYNNNYYTKGKGK